MCGGPMCVRKPKHKSVCGRDKNKKMQHQQLRNLEFGDKEAWNFVFFNVPDAQMQIAQYQYHCLGVLEREREKGGWVKSKLWKSRKIGVKQNCTISSFILKVELILLLKSDIRQNTQSN